MIRPVAVSPVWDGVVDGGILPSGIGWPIPFP